MIVKNDPLKFQQNQGRLFFVIWSLQEHNWSLWIATSVSPIKVVVLYDWECSKKISAKSGKVFLRHLEPSRAKCVIIKCNLSVWDRGGRFVCRSRMFDKILSRIREGHGGGGLHLAPRRKQPQLPKLGWHVVQIRNIYQFDLWLDPLGLSRW